MRSSILLGTVAGILLLCAAIVVSGRGVDGSAAPTVAVETIDPDMVGPGQPTDEEDEAVGEPADEPAAAELPAGATGAPDAAAAQPGGLPPHRIPPRRPLSPLGQAAQPDPDGKADWDGTPLYQPVATAAGTIEAGGYTVSLAGTQAVAPDEMCSYRGTDWPCGLRARTAFRALLRGRAVICALPQSGEAKQLAVPCRIGTENLGAWLVENGWARAAGDGPYAEAGRKAEESGKGIFGPPPRTLE